MSQATLLRDPNGESIQLFGYYSPARRAQVATAGAASTAATALPAGTGVVSTMVEVRASGLCYINFGTGSVSATADASSQLFPAGEKVQQIPNGATHFAVIRATDEDVIVQVELLR